MLRRIPFMVLGVLLCLAASGTPASQTNSVLAGSPETREMPSPEIGRRGGVLTFGQRTEPKSLNPLVATDSSSRQILGLLHADLLHINRLTHEVEPSLAESWTRSVDSRDYTLKLRSGLRFSDGVPMTADDVVFTFELHLNPANHSSQRDLLIVAGKPIQIRKIAGDSIRFTLAAPYAAGDRIFDGIDILPKHLLGQGSAIKDLQNAWPLTVPANQIAGLGPFRLKQYLPGERIVLERNPYYWKRDAAGNQLPYLDGIIGVVTSGAQGEAMRFGAGEIDVANRLSPADYVNLNKYEKLRHLKLVDLGPGLEFDFLFFNLNTGTSSSKPKAEENTRDCFADLAFRKAVATAIDRSSLVALAFRDKAYPLATFVPPGDRRWVNRSIPAWKYSDAEAKQILQAAGYSWNRQGLLQSPKGQPIGFSISFNAGNPQHEMMATLIQQDLAKIGVKVNVVALEQRSLLERVLRTFDYEAAIMALAGYDTDPNTEVNIWMSGGGTHVWDLSQKGVSAPWQKEVDQLMAAQMTMTDHSQRKVAYDRVQALVRANLPVITLVSPHVLVGAKAYLGNFQPAILSDQILWNAEYLFFRQT